MTGFTLAEVDHLLKALNTMSNYDLARAREQIEELPVDHELSLIHISEPTRP